MKFTYYKTQTMSPRHGNKFATTYYKLKLPEQKRLQKFIMQVAEEITHVQDPTLQDFVVTPLKKFKRTTTKGKYYTTEDIIVDMIEQIQSGKDIPSGMLGRWNRLFENTEYDIELVQSNETEITDPTPFQKLFLDEL